MSDRKLFAVAGRPILPSLSPVLFRSAYHRERHVPIYTRVSVSTAAEALAFGQEAGLSGLNVTAPLKDGVFALLDRVDETSAALGAVNTLVKEGRRFRGFNTDPAGVAGALAGAGITAGGKRCLVLGAGGAGRAAVLALRGLGAEVVLCNRTDEKAVVAARKLGVAAGRWAERASVLARSDILVSGLPRDAAAIRPEWLRPGLAVMDAAYPSTPLLRMAREQGCLAVAGEDWLFHQAIPAFRLLTGSDPDETAMASALKPARGRFSRDGLSVALIGFMGSGKTAAGRLLAEKLGLAFEDSDERIERQTGRTVSEIFQREGEAFFREQETKALRDILGGRTGVVCACGGGSMENAVNRAVVTARAIVVWLHAPPAVCRARIDTATRPLLGTRLKPDGAFGELFRARISCYAEASDIAVGSEGPEERTARIIHEEIRRRLAD
ncbi:MAG: shikimate kinase [Candidatus Aminicenantales bacterium]